MGEQRRRKQAGYSQPNRLLTHTSACCLLLALFIMTLLGVGSNLIVGALGVVLCVMGFGQEEARVDLWVLIPLVIYNLISAFSSFRTYGNLQDGFVSTQVIFPVLYLLLACLEKKEQLLLRQLCAAWAGLAALHGIGQFAYLALTTGPRRLSGLLGNPNAMGIFLVVGWFTVVSAVAEENENSRFTQLLRCLEPVVLLALSLTLSMGSFLSLAVGMAVLILRKEASWPGRFRFACRLLAEASLTMGTGILTYLAASRTDVSWSCILVLAYGALLAVHWSEMERFLEARPKAAILLTAAGVLVAGAAVEVRPSSLATFAERLAMMRNGCRYLFRNPLLGVGPYQWRLLNLNDDDKYFNTYHIHNVLIHVGVELGLIAMAALIVIVVRFWRKKSSPERQSGFAAFCFHCMMDTGFFYLGITGLALLTASDPQQRGTRIREKTLRGIFCVFAVIFIYNIVCAAAGG